MTLSRADFPRLKWSLLLFLCVLCAGAAAIILSENFIARAQHAQQLAQQQLNAARSQLAVATEDRDNMNAYAYEYGDLLRRNVIGDGQRLDWIEGLERIRKQKLVADFKYAIAPQRPYATSQKIDSGKFALGSSEMTLQFELLHEEQLMNFFDALRTDVNGWFILDHCDMTRNTDASATARLKATCSGGWLNMKSGSSQ